MRLRPQNDLGGRRRSLVDGGEGGSAFRKWAFLEPAQGTELMRRKRCDGVAEIHRSVAIGADEGDFLQRDLADIETVDPGQQSEMNDDSARPHHAARSR